MPSFFLPDNLQKDVLVFLKDGEFHHLKNVFKKKIGEEILLTNGKGSTAVGRILAFSKKECEIKILEVKSYLVDNPKIAVAFSLLKKKNDEFIVEKLTELGVKEFFPFIADRTIRKSSKNTKNKFEKKIIGAVKQCDNAFLPEINETSDFSKLFDELAEKNYLPIIASEIEKKTILEDLISENPSQKYCLIIGPEGGFSEKELEFISEKCLSFKIGNHILRAETAAVASVAQIFQIFLKQNNKFY